MNSGSRCSEGALACLAIHLPNGSQTCSSPAADEFPFREDEPNCGYSKAFTNLRRRESLQAISLLGFATVSRRGIRMSPYGSLLIVSRSPAQCGRSPMIWGSATSRLIPAGQGRLSIPVDSSRDNDSCGPGRAEVRPTILEPTGDGRLEPPRHFRRPDCLTPAARVRVHPLGADALVDDCGTRKFAGRSRLDGSLRTPPRGGLPGGFALPWCSSDRTPTRSRSRS